MPNRSPLHSSDEESRFARTSAVYLLSSVATLARATRRFVAWSSCARRVAVQFVIVGLLVSSHLGSPAQIAAAAEGQQERGAHQLRHIATLSGYACAIEIVDGLAYVGLDNDMVVVSAAGGPRVIGGIRFDRPISDMVHHDGSTYVRMDKALAIVDSTQPSQPTLLAELGLPPVDFRNGMPPIEASDGGGRIVTDGQIAVVATFEGNPYGYERVIRFLVADVSSPETPSWIANKVVHWTTVRLPGFDAELSDIVLVGEHAYLSYFTYQRPHTILGAISVMDLSTPSNPIEVGRHTVFDQVHALAAAGDRLLVSLGLGTLDGTGQPLPEPRFGLRALDISTPSTPRILGQDTAYDFTISDMTLAGGRVLAALGGDGLSLLDSAVSGRATEVARVDVVGEATRVETSGDVVYVTTGTAGLQVYRITGPTRPRFRTIYLPHCGWGGSLLDDHGGLLVGAD